MNINKRMKLALKAVTLLEPDVKKTYAMERRLENLFTIIPKMSIGCKVWDKTIEVENRNIPLRIFELLDVYSDSMLIFFHGGGWVLGNIDKYNKVCIRMAQLTGHIIVSVDYRLAPEFKFPIGLEDCYLATKEIFLNALFDISPEKITLIGDSAGANIAAALSLMARDKGEFLPRNQILLYPVTYNDHSENSPFKSIHENGEDYLLRAKRIEDFTQMYRCCQEDLYNSYYAPLIEKDLSRQPRTLIITAQYDPLRDEGECYGYKLRQAGNTVTIHRIEEALHGFFSLSPRFSQVKKAYEIINYFLSSDDKF